MAGDFIMFEDEQCEQYGYKFIDIVLLQLGSVPYEVAFYTCQ